MTNEAKMREDFEKWAKTIFCRYDFSYFGDGVGDVNYHDEEIDSAWMGYRAALAHSEQERIKSQQREDELRRKLAEQQATVAGLANMLPSMKLDYSQRGMEELNKLLSAEREAALREGEVIRQIELNSAAQRGYDKCWNEFAGMDAVGYVRAYGVECLQGTLMNKTTGMIPLPSSTVIDPYPISDDDISLIPRPERKESK